MAGFKSFADRTRVQFPDGITAIIGPNGCGKSNLSDAIGWVLGLQTAKNLRGQKMDDFIFGGTQKRKASGFTEVTLKLERTDESSLDLEGIQLEGRDVEISRKLYRSGESVYLVNQRRCRLMDIHKFLGDAGLGFSSYAMIAQGRIDAFLVSKPLERRALIEEAAQIAGYKAKRRNAELKLELAQQNLLRLNDILSEIERQLRTLKRQAGKARRYRKLKEEYRRIQRFRFRAEAEKLAVEITDLRSRLAVLRTSEQDFLAELREREASHREAAQAREAVDAELTAQRERKAQLDLDLDRSINSIATHRQQREETASYLLSIESERAALAESLTSVETELERFARERQAEELEEEKAAEALREAQEEARDLAARLERAETGQEGLRNRLLAVTAETAALRNLREQLVHRKDRIQSDLRRLERERGEYAEQLDRSRLMAEERGQALEARRTQLAEVRERVRLNQEEIGQLAARLSELEQQEKALHGQWVALKERLQSLQELELNRSNYSDGVKKVLGHFGKSGAIKAAGTLADALETEPQYEKLVEEFLDEELEYILVDSLDEAVRGVDEAHTLRSGKCSFLTLFSSNGFGKSDGRTVPEELPDRSAGVYGTLSEIVRMKPAVQDAFLRVMPRQAEAIVVSDLDRAMHLAHTYPESTFITLNGDSLTPRGLVSASASGSAKLGLLGLKRQRKDLEARSHVQEAALQKAVVARQAKVEDLRQARLRLEEGQSRVHQSEKACIGLEHETEQAEQEIRRAEKALQAVERERDQLAVEDSEIHAQLEGIAINLKGQEELRDHLDRDLNNSREEVAELRSSLASVQHRVNGLQASRRVLEERRAALESTLRRVGGQKADLEARSRNLGLREEESRSRLDSLAASIAALEQRSLALAEEREIAGRELVDLSGRADAIREGLASLAASVEASRKRRDDALEACSRVEIDLARVETQYQNLEAQCLEQLRAPLAEALGGEDSEEFDAAEVEKRYERLRKHLENFGPINMTALQEYKESLERHTFLTEQRSDIEQSIADTGKAIQEINRRSRSRFSEAFENINRNFKEVFQILFEGGDCGMTLLDAEDVLESGIDLYAQPPGKRLQNVMLLSGGEKTLTVFALLVAIFMYRPSRFCVLDEVDAPLDDANIQRFTNLIRQMSAETQFVVVTHNKRTMESADAMYGITMEEPGVSKVVSARF